MLSIVTILSLLGAPIAPSAPPAESDPRDHWSFRPLAEASVPTVEKDASWAHTDLDRFILAAAQAKKITPNPTTDRRTLIRRAYFDLIGLAPTREEVEAFVADESPDAWDKVIARLLESPHYGERWARHWLDVARFGESHGYESDNERPEAWTYRDAVIRAHNEDLPFDRFVRYQIAGDQLGGGDALATALTGFITAGSTVTNVDGVDREKARYDKMDDIVSATGSAFLALTLGCARCHDHKYDPIAQKDYYRLVGFFLPGGDRKQQVAIGREGQKVNALIWGGGGRRKNPLLDRGDTEAKGEDVGTGVLGLLSPADGDLATWLEASGAKDKNGDGRPGLAHWLTDVESGAGALVARVVVNRLWQHHFGVGLVRTSNNFGKLGEKPTHPKLLDWLARELIRHDWRLKTIHRLILRSAVYTQSTKWDRARHEIDPENSLIWRRRPRRLEAEILRDSIMNTAGTLNRTLYGPSIKPWVSNDAINTGSTNKWPTNVKDGPNTWRRSVYVFMRRSMRVPFFETFDTPDAMSSRGKREETTVPTQALLLLNNEFVRGQAAHFAKRVSPNEGEDRARIVENAYWLAFSRAPTDDEREMGVEFISSEGQSVENFCHLLLTLNEFIYVD